MPSSVNTKPSKYVPYVKFDSLYSPNQQDHINFD